jgi:hypothetical protein
VTKVHRIIALLAIVLGIAVLVGACAAPQSSVPKTAPPPPSPAQPATLTVGQLAEQGKVVFATKATCHGDSGQGGRAPAIIGANAQLAKYNNAKELCFMVLQNKFATADTAIDPNQLERLVLKK